MRAERPGARYPAIVRLRNSGWAEFVPLLAFDVEVRLVVCSTNANRVAQRPDPASRASPRPLPDRAGRPQMPLPRPASTGPDRHRTGTMDHTLEASVNAFSITFADRLPAAETY
jgi:hypothetical protein